MHAASCCRLTCLGMPWDSCVSAYLIVPNLLSCNHRLDLTDGEGVTESGPVVCCPWFWQCLPPLTGAHGSSLSATAMRPDLPWAINLVHTRAGGMIWHGQVSGFDFPFACLGQVVSGCLGSGPSVTLLHTSEPEGMFL